MSVEPIPAPAVMPIAHNYREVSLNLFVLHLMPKIRTLLETSETNRTPNSEKKGKKTKEKPGYHSSTSVSLSSSPE
jgi:hypothetical protein